MQNVLFGDNSFSRGFKLREELSVKPIDILPPMEDSFSMYLFLLVSIIGSFVSMMEIKFGLLFGELGSLGKVKGEEIISSLKAKTFFSALVSPILVFKTDFLMNESPFAFGS